MTFAVLRALHSIIGDALDDIQRVYGQDPPSSDSGEPLYASPPPSPSKPTHPRAPLDFPSLDALYDPTDPAELLRAHPAVIRAISKIVSATGQISATVQIPFLTLMDASMGYHLPSCLRLLEASNIVEILRAAGSDGVHVDTLSRRTAVDSARLAHILRLLATHHILREREHDIFTLNRISSMVDSGKSIDDLQKWENEGRPEMKYHTTNGIAALIGLNTDDLQKTSAYMTEAYLLARANPPIPPFQYAFGTDVPWFPWLEGEGAKQGALSAPPSLSSPARVTSAAPGLPAPKVKPAAVNGHVKGKKSNDVSAEDVQAANPNRYRLERFGAAMQGTGSWEMPGAILLGFDWRALPRGSVIVDVGGGIGSTSMLLANAFSRPGDDQDMGLRFVIQDRPVVVEMGEKAWRAKYPELLDSDTARFQAHDFFDPQPIKNAAVFLLRVVLHDWADAQARKILERLREAATENTKLLMADFVLPLACPDNVEASEDGGENILEGVEGAEKTLAAPPLLANLGKASSHAYWMDMTMQTVFNAQERTLREIVALARSAGWKVVKVTRAEGSLFGHIVAVPACLDSDAAPVLNGISTQEAQVALTVNGLSEHSMSRVGTPTFGSRLDLPSVQESRLAKLKSKVVGFMNRGRSNSVLGTARQSAGSPMTSTKKKPSPLSFPPSSLSDKPLTSPRRSQASSVTKAPPSPLSPKHLPSQSMSGAIPTSSSSPIPNSSQTELPAQPTTPVRRSMKEAPSSPRHSKHPSVSSLSRRLSLSKQQPEGLRRRSGSGFGASINGVANFLSSRRSGILNFGDSGNKGRESPSGNELPNLPNSNGQTTVLAEAAQIDIGVPVTVAPPSP